MSDKPISDLRARGIADMTIRTFGEKTRHDYIRHVEAFAKFLGRSPDTATGDDICRFQMAQVEKGAQPPKMNTQTSALCNLLQERDIGLRVEGGRVDAAVPQDEADLLQWHTVLNGVTTPARFMTRLTSDEIPTGFLAAPAHVRIGTLQGRHSTLISNNILI
jgi:hypothetical protein